MATLLACLAVRTDKWQIVRVHLSYLIPGLSVEFETRDGARWLVTKTLSSRTRRGTVWGSEMTHVRVQRQEGAHTGDFQGGYYTVVAGIQIGHQFSMIDPAIPGRRIALEPTTKIRITR